MVLHDDFITKFESIDPRELVEMMRTKVWPKDWRSIAITNEIRPADLFCYLGARFGRPNGLQNFLRADDSDNLIHWEWTLRHETGLISFIGMSFRTEIHIQGAMEWNDDYTEKFIAQIKSDFAANGKRMGEIRNTLEDWIEFVNPYQRVKRSIEMLKADLDSLQLGDDSIIQDFPWEYSEDDETRLQWKETSEKYSKGFGICFGIRSMLPVLAEAYVNILLFVLMKPELKEDERLRENVFRQPIDVRIKSLSVNCIGFSHKPDYSSDACRNYHTLVNERNDLLHGNVVIDKLKFNEVYFLGKIPIFKEYRTMWQRSFEIEMNAVGLSKVEEELKIVLTMIEYLNSCLDESYREQIKQIAESYDLGFNKSTKRIGKLFPPWLSDIRVGKLPDLKEEDEDDGGE